MLVQHALKIDARVSEPVAERFDADRKRAKTFDGELLEMIVSSDVNLIIGSVFGAESLDDFIGRLVGAGIENLDAAGLAGFVEAHAFAIEDSDDAHAAGVLIFSERFHQSLARQARVALVLFQQFWPREDDAVTIHDEVLHEGRS